MLMARKCTVSDCERARRRYGLCDMHSQRLRRNRSVDTIAPWASMTETERFWSKTKTVETGCVEWQGERNSQGYGRFAIYRDGVRSRILAHRYALALNEVIPAGAVVMHACDNRLCVNPSHLSTGTQLDNIRDAITKGRADLSGLELRHRHQAERRARRVG